MDLTGFGAPGRFLRNRRHSGILRSAAAMALIAASVVVPGAPSSANNIFPFGQPAGCANGSGTTRDLSRADDRNVYVWYDTNMVDQTRTAMSAIRANIYDPDPLLQTIYEFSPNGSTDVLVRNQHYTTLCGINWPGTWGHVECIGNNGQGECDQFNLRFNLGRLHPIGSTPVPQSWWNTTACHEFGHTTALKHRHKAEGADAINSCMQELHPNDLPFSLSGHDRGHYGSL